MDTRIRALYVSSISGIGGAELCLAELIKHLDPDCCTPLLYLEQPGPLVERFEQLGVPVIWGSFPFFRKRYPHVYWRAVWRLWRTIKQRKIDIVHINCDRAVPIAVTAARLAAVPCVCYIHDLLRAWYLPRYVKHLNRAQAITANSRATASRCLEAGMEADKIRVIYPPIDFSRFADSSACDKATTRRELGLPADAVVIGIIGKLIRNKGHEEILRALALAAPSQPGLRLLVVGDTTLTGDDEFPAELARLAADLNITEQVVFAGFRDDVPAIMLAIDVLAVPSRSEAFGRSAAEGLAVGIPVIASDVDGLPEVVQHNVTGLLIPPKDIAALADAILILAGDPELRRRMGERGPASVARFDVTNHVSEVMRLYSDLTGSRSCAARDHGEFAPEANSIP